MSYPPMESLDPIRSHPRMPKALKIRLIIISYLLLECHARRLRLGQSNAVYEDRLAGHQLAVVGV